MKTIKITGLAFFLFAFTLFNASMFINHYRITPAILEQTGLSAEQQQLLQKNSPDLLTNNFSKLGLIKTLDTAFENVNNVSANSDDDSNTIWGKTDIVSAVAVASSLGLVTEYKSLFIFLIFGLGIIGAFMFMLPGIKESAMNNNNVFFNALSNRGWLATFLFIYFVGFYYVFYYYPALLSEPIILTEPLSLLLSGHHSSNWFVYGVLYTLIVFVLGIKFIIKYRHSRYHLIRTISVMFFQTIFAFLIPQILMLFKQPSIDLKNMWPLDYYFFYESHIHELSTSGGFGHFALIWGITLFAVAVPVITYFVGKRWYCSWVCGCGGLAETGGDAFRHLSSKKLSAWRIERISIYSVLIFAIVMTASTLYSYFSGKPEIAGIKTDSLQNAYGFFIGMIFAGFAGTGLYPLMGNRVWCRFGCPLSAYIGIVQRFKSRFRITTNGGQCISCGNCSTYCEMGIDVRSYAQRGENIVRASCVGCGICASVCPRGVLKLENGPISTRFQTSQ